MKLIKEEVLDTQFIIENAENNEKKYFIEGIFMQSEKKNRNGRVYPYNTLLKEVNRYNSEYVEKNRAFGELGHPDTPNINLDRVSHMIKTLRPDGTNFIGKAEILDTPMGKIVKSLLDGGANLGVSTRGVGSLKPSSGYQIVQDDFKLATAADIVADPSAPDAFVRSLKEDADWILTASGWKEQQHERAKKILNEASQKNIEDVSLAIFSNFIQSISKSRIL